VKSDVADNYFSVVSVDPDTEAYVVLYISEFLFSSRPL
jgi:hypothetical protein